MTSKNVLITGSTSGIGLGMATCFAQAGYNVALHGLEPDGPQIAKDVSAEYGVKTCVSSADLANADAVASLVAQAQRELGAIDVLVNNAGIQCVAPIDEFSAERWDAVLAVNLSAAFHTARAVWPSMKTRGFGRIINIASAHGLRASEYKAAYVAAKHGLIGLTKVLALEGAPLGITANAICPGYVRTPLVEGQIKKQALAHGISEDRVIDEVMLKKQAIKQFVTVESLAAMALFLASAHGSTTTGTAIPMDGGWSAQ